MKAPRVSKVQMGGALALLLGSVAASNAQVISITNPGFDQGFTSGSVHGYDTPGSDIVGWSNFGTTYTDSGVTDQAPGAQAPTPPVAYVKSGDDGAIQVTGHTIGVGETFTLNWDAVSLAQAASQTVFLFRVDQAFGSFQALAVSNDAITATPQTFALQYTAQPGDVGNLLGVGFGAGDAGYVAYDNFTFVPEPATWTLISSVALGGVCAVRRFRTRKS